MRNGGVEAVVMNYYRNIDRTKIQYDFIIDEDSSNTHLVSEIEALGGKVITVPPYQKPFAYHKALYQLFTQNHYPLVYSHINTLSVFPLFAAWRAGIPIRVAHSHSTAGKGEFTRNVMKYTLRKFSRVFATEWCACSRLAGEFQFGKKAMDSGRVLIWPNAMDVKRFAFDEQRRAELRRSMNLEGKFVIGHTGRFMLQKNHSFLIDTFAALKKRKPEAVLMLVGDGPLQNMCREKVNALGLTEDVIFTGSVNDTENYYQVMDAFIFPSFYEGLGMSAVEAQICGLPVVCSDELPEEAGICENIKFLPLSMSPAEWADETLKLCEGCSRHDMSMSAREHSFDITVHADRMTKWYCTLLGIA